MGHQPNGAATVAQLRLTVSLQPPKIESGVSSHANAAIPNTDVIFAVAVVAIPLGVCAERHERFTRIAESHWSDACALPVVVFCRLPLGDSDKVAWYEWHRDLSWKYARAAERPWLPVEPDPPAPE